MINRIVMTFLEANFFTALPAIIIGMICFGVLYFLIFALMSKASGRSIGFKSNYSNSTWASPDDLDNLGKGLRKLVDKKYRIKTEVEEEFNMELHTLLAPIEAKVNTIFSMRSNTYRVGMWAFSKSHPYEDELLNSIGRTYQYYGYKNEKLSLEDLERLEKILFDLLNQKKNITAKLASKYGIHKNLE